MAEGHGRDRWGRLSVLCSLIANCNRDPKKGRAFKPSDFNPYEGKPDEAIEITPENIGSLKQVFLQRHGKGA